MPVAEPIPQRLELRSQGSQQWAWVATVPPLAASLVYFHTERSLLGYVFTFTANSRIWREPWGGWVGPQTDCKYLPGLSSCMSGVPTYWGT